jgi:opacity protein-like surface antigen
MKRFLITLVVSAVFMTTSAQAATNGKMYFSASGGLSLTDDLEATGVNISFDPGFNIGGALGYDMGRFRVEGEIRYHSVDIDTVNGVSSPISADLSALTFMANGYYDVEMKGSPLTPYLGVGLGLVSSEITAGAFSADEEDLGYQFMLGLGYDVSKTAMLTAEYRYFGIVDSDAPNTHAFIFGARFMF